MKKLKFFLFIAVILTYPVGILSAPANVKTLKKEAQDISHKIEKNKNQIQVFTQKEAKVINQLNKTDMALNTAKKQVDVIQEELAGLEKKITAATAESEELKKQIQKGEAYAARRMVALYKLNCSGKMNLLASAGSVNDLLQQKIALERILAHDENVLKTLSQNKTRLSEILNNLNIQKKEKLSLEENCKKQVNTIAHEKARRSALLGKIRKEKSLMLASVKSLEKAANELERKIKTLKARQKEQSKKSFTSFKGVLKMPVDGKIISFFGTSTDNEFNVKTFQSGIDIEAEKGASIRAAGDGEVVYASWFKGYGNMIIIDHGNHCHTVYAHADKLLKKEGEQVRSGEIIATVGDTGSFTGTGLHFEVRRHGKSVDPVKWLSKKN